MKKHAHLLWRCTTMLVVAGLLVACVGAGPTATPRGSQASEPTQSVEATIAATVTPGPVDPAKATPLDTAAAIRIGGWSPDSHWLAYWTSSENDVTIYPPGDSPVGTLHFASVETGQTCDLEQFAALRGSARVHWSDDEAVVIQVAESVFAGRPCQTEPFAPLVGVAPETDQHVDPALSPEGRYRAATTLLASESGILTFETTLATQDERETLQRIAWQIDERLGDYGLMGEWINRDQFLIYETLAQGPLILDSDGSVISVLNDLFGIAEVPSIVGEQGYSLRAYAAPGVEPTSFHLLLGSVGLEGAFPAVMLYHAESESVETLPYRALWGSGFSEDRQWLLMDERPTVNGYETYAVWTRRTDDVAGDWRLLAHDIDALQWIDGGNEMAFSSDNVLTWQTFPAVRSVGRWDTAPYGAHPVTWSPNQRFLVAVGNIPGQWQSALFVLERPSGD